LRRISGPKREEDGSWRKLHNDELHSLYSSPNIIRVIKSRRMKWAGHVARMGEGRSVYRVLVGRFEVKRLLGRLRHRWEDNIKLDLRALGYGPDDRGSRFRFPAGTENFSLHHRIQNGSGAHPASYPVGIRVSFPGGKAAGSWS
jgi:hypothetical protein